MNIKSILFAILVFSGIQLHASSPEVHFRHITINDGLSLSSIYGIYQDSKGFMWFATEDGLNKYDGRNFTVYSHIPGNPNSLTNKWIERILEDRYGNLWLGSRRGLTHLDPSSDQMLQFLHSDQGNHQLVNDTIIALIEHGNFIWLANQSGINRINTKTLISENIAFENQKGASRVNVLCSDANDNLWLGSCSGLLYFDPKTDSVINVVKQLPGKENLEVHSLFAENDTLWVGSQHGLLKFILSDDPNSKLKYQAIITEMDEAILNIYRDSGMRLWIQTSSGLHRYENSRIKIVVEAADKTPSLAIRPVKPLLEDTQGNMWYGTFQSGIYRIMASSQEIQHISHEPAFPSSLSDNTINCISMDRAGAIWIGTFGSGINIYNPRSNIIQTLRHNAFDAGSMSSSFVWSILEDHKGRVWIGTNTTGINLYDQEKKSFSYFKHQAGVPGSLPAGAVREIFQSSDKTIWVGTDGGGLSKFNPATGSFKNYRNETANPNSLSDNSVRTIFEDSTGILWIGTRNGLNRFDPVKQNFTQYLHDPDKPGSISHNFVYSAIYMDKKGALWIGTYGGGLNKMDPETGEFSCYRFDPNNPSSISDDIVFSIYEDQKGYLWIGTNSGLNLFNPSTGKFARYGLTSGLPNEVIYGIMPDYKNQLWLTTNKGISRLDLTEFKFKNLDVRDGLQSNEFNGGAYHLGKSGTIYAGGVYGLNIIDPERIAPEQNEAEIIISRLEILGKDVEVNPDNINFDSTENSEDLIELVDNFYLPKHVTYIDEVKLNYRQRFFSIEFAALNHHMPEKLNYRYRMQNLEDYWNLAGNRNYVTYANMKPGVYIFEVNASNGDGFLSKNPAELKIIIKPPFWRSYWFILILILIMMLVTVFIYRYLLNQRTNKLLQDQYTQIKIAHEQLQASENNLQELNAMKDKFFSIISHDLKNPFASVLSISELMDTNFEHTEADEIRYGVKKIHETNQHIYSLLENLLTWSKSQRGKMTIENEKFNITKLIETNVNVLKLSSEKKELNIKCLVPDDLCALGDREMISTVFRNLLNNAIKFSPIGKTIEIKAEKDKGLIRLSLKDNGIGISPDNLNKLFTIDEKFKTDGTAGEKGTGLGLIICKEFVEKNGGQIEVSSILNEGSTFSFTIPSANNEKN